MDAVEDTERRSRAIERDIERTREEMDHTLTALEHRLRPSEILHRGTETLRERVRQGMTNALETLKRNPAPVALASVIIGAGLAFRPTAAERQRRRAEEDFERAWSVLATAVGHAKEQSRYGAAKLAEQSWETMQRAREESRELTRALRRDAAANPLGSLALLAVVAGTAWLGTRRRHAAY